MTLAGSSIKFPQQRLELSRQDLQSTSHSHEVSLNVSLLQNFYIQIYILYIILIASLF